MRLTISAAISDSGAVVVGRVTGEATYPAERVLLTSGVLEAAIDSRYNGAMLEPRIETFSGT